MVPAVPGQAVDAVAMIRWLLAVDRARYRLADWVACQPLWLQAMVLGLFAVAVGVAFAGVALLGQAVLH